MLARDDLSGWVEGRAIDAANSFNVSMFQSFCTRKLFVDMVVLGELFWMEGEKIWI